MKELERFKKEIDLVEYALTHNYTEFDRNQSSRTCVVLRRQADDGKIAVSRSHDGHWVYYDFRCNKGGSILDFVMQQSCFNLGRARQELRKGLPHNIKSFPHTARFFKPRTSAKDRRRAAWEYADTSPVGKHHNYLERRGIFLESVLTDRFTGVVRGDRYGNACFPYFDFGGVAGVEKRNNNFKCYTKGGRKGLFDGLMQKYRSQKIAIILAFDNDPEGRAYILQFHERYPGEEITIDLPPRKGQDWNDALQKKL